MKTLKKIMSIILILAMIMQYPVITHAEDATGYKVTMVPDKTAVDAGDTVTVTIVIDDINVNGGIGAYQGVVSYDTNVFELNLDTQANINKNVKGLGDWERPTVRKKTMQDGENIQKVSLIAETKSGELYNDRQEVASLTFTSLQDSEIGPTSITMDNIKTSNGSISVVTEDTEADIRQKGETVSAETGVTPVNGVVTIPSEINGRAVTDITDNVISDLSDVTEIIIPDSVVEISENAFKDEEGNTNPNITIKCSEESPAKEYAKQNNMNYEIRDKNIKEIEVVTENLKTQYNVNDPIDLSGGKLKLIYEDDEESYIKLTDSGVEVTGFDSSKGGTNTVTVTYKEKTKTFDITINKEIAGISIKTAPEKTSYIQNFDELDLKGGVITVTYNDTTTEDVEMMTNNSVTEGITTTGYDKTTIGTQTITLSYGGQNTTFDVTVVEKSVSNIVIKEEPIKKDYYVGDELDSAGLEITVTYDDTSTADITTGLNCTPTTLTTEGTQEITVTYGGKTVVFNVNVNPVALDRIEVKTNPTKVNYFVGDELNQEGLALKGINNNGSEFDITSGFTCNPTTLNTAGEQTITVTYEGKETTFKVNVIAIVLDRIEVKTMPTKTDYYTGDTLNTEGLVLRGINNNGSEFDISTGFTCNPTILNTAGTQEITVTYEGKTTKFNVNVTAVALDRIEVKTNPTKTDYYVGDTLNTAGLVLKGTRNNGSEFDITSGFTCNTTTLNTAGEQTITVTYEGKETTFKVNVVAIALDKIEVKTNPIKTDYYVGDTLNTEGLVLKGINNNGSEFDITSGFTCNPTTLSTAGEQTITVTYEGKETSFKVNVVEIALDRIEVKTSPTKTSYFVGEDLNTSGLVLKGINNDGSEFEITTGFICNVIKLNTVGEQTVKVTYEGKETTFKVNVAAIALDRIELKTTPTKTSYIQGVEDLDLTGGKITAINTDGTTEDIDMNAEGIRVTGFSNIMPGTKQVTISYGGKTTTFEVTIIAKTLTQISINKNPNKMAYIIGEELDLTGGILNLVYNETITEELDMTDRRIRISGFDSNTIGSKAVTLNYEGQAITINVDVTKDKVDYSQTEDGNGAIITKIETTEDNGRVEIPNEIGGKPVVGIGDNSIANIENINTIYIPSTVTEISDKAFEGNDEITIECESGSYAEQYAKIHNMNYELIDKTIGQIEIYKEPDQKIFKTKRNLNVTGGRILLIYTDNTTSIISMKKTGVELSGYDNTSIGTQEITVTYKQKTTSFKIEVIDGIELGDINQDEGVNATDLLLLKRHIIAGDKTEWILTGDAFKYGDMNEDNKINATDLLLLKRKIINYIKEGE